MAGVGWPCCLTRPSLIDGHRPKLPRSLAATPAHSPPTQPVARTTFGMGDDWKSGCGAQEGVQSQVKSQKYFIPTRPQYSMHKSETSTQSSKEKATQKGESR